MEGLLLDKLMSGKAKALRNLESKNKKHRMNLRYHLQELKQSGRKFWSHSNEENTDILPGQLLDVDGLLGDIIVSKLLDNPKKDTFRSFISTGTHSETRFFIDHEGRLFGNGYNSDYQLGCGHNNRVLDLPRYAGQLNKLSGWDHVYSNNGYTQAKRILPYSHISEWYHWGTFVDSMGCKHIIKTPELIENLSEINNTYSLRNTYSEIYESLTNSNEHIHVYLGKYEITGETINHIIGEIDLYRSVYKNPGGRKTRMKKVVISDKDFQKIRDREELPHFSFHKSPDIETILLTHMFIDEYHELTLDQLCDIYYDNNSHIKHKFNKLLGLFDR